MAKVQEERSMLEAAEYLIKRKIKPQKFQKIAKEVFELMGITDDEDIAARTAQLYTDLSLSGKFVALNEGLWDLKSRQLFEEADYDTYELDFETEEATPLLGDDAPVGVKPISAILESVPDVDDEDEDEDEDDEDIIPISDDYGDDSDAELDSDKPEDHLGLTVYSEEELEG